MTFDDIKAARTQADKEELDAMEALLSAHPKWGERPISIRDALKCRKIPKAIKKRYMDIYHARYPTSQRLDKAKTNYSDPTVSPGFGYHGEGN